MVLNVKLAFLSLTSAGGTIPTFELSRLQQAWLRKSFNAIFALQFLSNVFFGWAANSLGLMAFLEVIIISSY